MDPTTRNLWLEDRRGVVDRHRDLVWWTALQWVTAGGLACALVLWGWRGLVIATLMVTVTAFCVLSLRVRGGAFRVVRLADDAVLTGLTTTGAAGLVAVAGGWALLILAALGATAPPVRRLVTDAVALLRLSRELARHAGHTRPTTWSDGYDRFDLP